MFFAVDAKFFSWKYKKKINNIFLVNSNKIFIGSYLNEKLCWTNQIFVDSTKHFSGCARKRTVSNVTLLKLQTLKNSKILN